MCYTCWRNMQKEQDALKDQMKLEIYKNKMLCENS